MKKQLKHLPGYLLIACLLYMGTAKSIENYRLSKSGLTARAMVIKKKSVGSKGTIRCFYEFKVNEVAYSGFDHTKIFNAGDSIDVLYIFSKPEINRSKRFIEGDF